MLVKLTPDVNFLLKIVDIICDLDLSLVLSISICVRVTP